MENLHLEILDENRKNIFQKLAGFKKFGYLAGGTALALQVSHRISYDFDIFCNREISVNFPSKAREHLAIRETLINNRDEFTFLTDNNVKISFIFYPFDLSGYVIRDKDLPLDILSPQGVALTKAYALNRRNSWRDYLDLYFILKNQMVDLAKIITEGEKVYGKIFNEKLFLAQLLYVDDISAKEIEETELFSEKVTVEGVKEFFKKEIDNYLK